MNDKLMLDRRAWAGGRRASAAVAATAWILYIVVGIFDPAGFFRAYLPVYVFCLGLALGSMALLMVYHLTGGAWGFLIRRVLEAQMKLLPLLALLFLPIALGAHWIFPWMSPSGLMHPARAWKSWYLTPLLFYGRAALYFVAWLTLAFWLSRWSRQQDETRDAISSGKCLNLSGPGLVVYGITLHFAAIDWFMSVEPEFSSTMIGPLVAIGQMLSAYCLALVLFAWLLAPRVAASPVYSRKAQNDFGSLLLALLVVWAYLAWFEYMLIWMANLPQEAAWYAPRTEGAWGWLILLIVILQFAIPFVLLLFRSVKEIAGRLAWVAAAILCMQLIFNSFQILPAFSWSWTGVFAAPLAALALGGTCLSWTLWMLTRQPVLALSDFNEDIARRLRLLDEEQARREEEVFA